MIWCNLSTKQNCGILAVSCCFRILRQIKHDMFILHFENIFIICLDEARVFCFISLLFLKQNFENFLLNSSFYRNSTRHKMVLPQTSFAEYMDYFWWLLMFLIIFICPSTLEEMDTIAYTLKISLFLKLLFLFSHLYNMQMFSSPSHICYSIITRLLWKYLSASVSSKWTTKYSIVA